jgi:hypothetical protein
MIIYVPALMSLATGGVLGFLFLAVAEVLVYLAKMLVYLAHIRNALEQRKA